MTDPAAEPVGDRAPATAAGSANHSPTAGYHLSVNGTVDILFSRATLAAITRAFATYTILNWREGPNPPGEAAP